ncbi:MAG: ribose-5-phosphate isomerase RpiA [Bacteroidetes bacterium]|nr:ribose-5-phosphate isomerase RpiA [Bacteroidota bacterium]
MLSQEEMKRAAGEYAAQLIKPGFVTGIGTGSTVYYFIHALAGRVKEGLDIKATVTSKQSATLAQELGIIITDLNNIDNIDITVDGADEVDNKLQLIKGGGGALLQEKMVAAASHRLVIIADDKKVVNRLGKFPLPVEVIPYGWKQTRKHIAGLNCTKIVLREKESIPFITDHGHYILDCHFEEIEDPGQLSIQLNSIPGVVENGLFINMASEIIIGKPDGTIHTISK